MSGQPDHAIVTGARFLLPYCQPSPVANGRPGSGERKSAGRGIAATIINGMRPEKIGRAFGIGLRVAGRVAGERLAAAAQPTPPQQVAPVAPPTASVRPATAQGSSARGSVSQGVGGFFRPFRRVGGILWLEVTGVFFLLPVLVFAPTVWRTRLSWAHGPDHRTFVVSAIVVVVFLYLGVTSFLRARRK